MNESPIAKNNDRTVLPTNLSQMVLKSLGTDLRPKTAFIKKTKRIESKSRPISSKLIIQKSPKVNAKFTA